jgi:hypothetical protein
MMYRERGPICEAVASAETEHELPSIRAPGMLPIYYNRSDLRVNNVITNELIDSTL